MAYGFTINVDGNSIGMMRQIEAALASMGARATIETRRVESSFTGMSNRVGGSFRELKRLILGGIGIAAGVQGLSGFFKLGSDMEQTNVAFEVMLGSAEKAKDMIVELRKYAAATPFTTKDIAESAKLMMNFGIAQKNVMPYIKMLGDASSGNAERFKLMSLAFSQISSAGKLMGQDLLQLINAGFNPLQTISQKTGISMGELRKKMEKGQISFQMVADAFKVATSQGGMFNGMMDKQSQTVGGKWSTLVDNIQIKLIQIFDNIKPTLMALIDNIGKMAQVFFDHVVPAITSAVDAFNVIYNVIAENIGIIKTVTYTVLSMVIAYKAINGIIRIMIVLKEAWLSMRIVMLYAGDGLTALKTGFGGLSTILTGLSSPVGIITAVVGGLTLAYSLLSKNIKEASKDTVEFGQHNYDNVKVLSDQTKVLIDNIKEQGKMEWINGNIQRVSDAKARQNSQGIIDKQIALIRSNGELNWGDIMQISMLKNWNKKGAKDGGPTFGGFTSNASNTSSLTGGKGGLGEAKIINIHIDTMQKVSVADGKDLKSKGQDAVEVMLRAVNNLAYSQSSTQ
jgi:tape measure domain-containing protein